jgi:hypothetical protein
LLTLSGVFQMNSLFWPRFCPCQRLVMSDLGNV